MGTTVEDVFRDFEGRRAGLIKALTTDVDELITLCGPGTLNYWLYGFPNATWDVVNWSSYKQRPRGPPEIPDPVFGITFDGEMDREQWLSFMAAHSNAWLMGVAIFLGQRQGLGRDALGRLFEMIIALPTISEVVIGGGRKPEKDDTQESSTKNKSSGKPECESRKRALPEEDGGIEGEGGNVLCGACGKESFDEFSICCDVCGTRYHGSCVGITPAAAEAISSTYMCPSCSSMCPSCRNKRQRR